MVLVAHYDLQLHQKDVKTHSSTGICMEKFTWHNLKGFVRKERKGCCLKKSIYGLKQASRHWYLNFDSTIRKFGFKENVEDNCIYAKFKHGKSISLILHVDSTLLANSGVNLLLEKKQFLSSSFNENDLGKASFVPGIGTYRDKRKRGIRTISSVYLEKILKK